MILNNRAKCLKCGDIIFSAHRHDFKECSCGDIFVDGGMSYKRHGYANEDTYQDYSSEISEELLEGCKDALKWADETGRNDLGKICAIFRAIKDEEFRNE